MRWMIAAAAAGALAWGCGGDGPSADAEALMQAAVDAVIEPGMVFHAETGEGSEIWIDGERELFRAQSGEEGDSWFHVGVAEGWTLWSFDAWQNEVEKEQLEPPVDFPSRIDNPAILLGFSPLTVLAYGESVEVAGEKESEGRDVVVVETKSIMEGNDHPEGSTSVWRVELDRESHLVVATEWSVIPPEGEGETEGDSDDVHREVYETEFIPREELPEDFFSPQVLYDAVITFEERLEVVRALGITPYWLGERFEAKEGELVLSSVWDVHTHEDRGEATVRYSSLTPRYAISGGLGDTVVITLRPAGAAFEPPEMPPLGPKPESEEEVTVQGHEGILYTSELRPEAVVCAVGLPCITPEVPLYHRLVVTLDDTTIEVEALAKANPEVGEDENPFNNREGILALARALEPAR
jgi:hypothetical protein